ncbi:chemotaxis protein CheB [Alloalcanivorax sp. C16-1]|uniref:chemotaxis protein CheB n=1 Tax=Alloalcanivorax sp. C16-1 TaxID=3390051 RepID=UPI0039708696
MAGPGRVGVIADDTLQGHLLAAAIKGQGYRVLVSTAPDSLEDRWLEEGALDLWVVDLSREDRWQPFLDRLLEQAAAPLLFCDGQAPARTASHYPRWERRLVTKLVDYIGKPAVERLDTVPRVPAPAPIPRPREFQPLADGEGVAERVWVLGASLGGPAAVKQFLDALPPHLPVAFVLAQHIDAGFLETLCQVLRRDSRLDCQVAGAGSRLGHGRLLVAPVSESIEFDRDGGVRLTGQSWEGPYAPSIDQVLHNVAGGFGGCAGAIVFSGMGNDGAIAAPRLATAGTTVWAQTADSCAVSSQPDAVRETGCVSYSGTPEQLARQLVERVRREVAVAAP